MSDPDIARKLDPLFHPRSVAVIGATNNITKRGYSTFSSIKSLYKRDLYPVNNKDKKVLGVTAYSTVKDIPGHVDLAVIVVPSHVVIEVMSDCAQKGVKAAVVVWISK